jgi:hypothetical protein
MNDSNNEQRDVERKWFTRSQLREVLEEAAGQKHPSSEERFSQNEIEQAASEAGIDRADLQQAITRVEQKAGSRSALAFVALGAILLAAAMLLLPSKALSGWRQGSVLLQNKHRRHAFTFEILVPTPATHTAPNCNLDPTARVAARDYCVAQRVLLDARRKQRVRIPGLAQDCPQIWVRTYRGDSHEPARLHRAALFSLPAAIKIDRKERLDQKGIGHPHMHPAPKNALSRYPTCAAALKGDRHAD